MMNTIARVFLSSALLAPAVLAADATVYDTFESWSTFRIPRVPGIEVKSHGGLNIRYFYVEDADKKPQLLIYSALELNQDHEGTPMRGVVAGKEMDGKHAKLNKGLTGDLYDFPCGAEGAKCRIIIYDGPQKAVITDMIARMEIIPGKAASAEDKQKVEDYYCKITAANTELTRALEKVKDAKTAAACLPQVRSLVPKLNSLDREFMSFRKQHPCAENMSLIYHMTSVMPEKFRTQSAKVREQQKKEVARIMKAAAYGNDELLRLLTSL